MYPGGRCALLTASLLAVFCIPVQAGFSLELEAGTEYDSNVAVDETDTNSGLGDQATTLQLALGYSHTLGRHGSLSGRYQLHDSRWQQYSTYDTRMHTGLLRAGVQYARLSADVAMIHARAEVDGQDFLQLSRISPGVGWLLSRQWYARVQGDLTEKQFTGFTERDSDGAGASLYLYRFIDRTRFYLSSQLQWKHEQTTDPVYAYESGSLRLQLRRDWLLGGLTFTTRLQGRYEHRQYEAIRTDIGAVRVDERWRLGLDTRLQISRRWSLDAAVHNDWFDSNLPVADYNQQRYRLGIGWAF